MLRELVRHIILGIHNIFTTKAKILKFQKQSQYVQAHSVSYKGCECLIELK